MLNKKNSDNFKNSNINNSFVNIGDGNTYILKNQNIKLVFNEKKFKETLDLLDREFTDKNIYASDIKPNEIIRNQEDKNKRHNISEDDYNLIINKISSYEKEMDNFFKNPRNKRSIRIYKQLLDSFNMILRAYKKEFGNIFCFFLEINDKMKERYSEEIENYEDDLISLFLYYAYYLCDLDKDKVNN